MPRNHRYRCFLPDLAGFAATTVTRTRPSTTTSSSRWYLDPTTSSILARAAGDSRREHRAGIDMAEREGFEPSVACATHDFQSCTFGHSVTSPDHVDPLRALPSTLPGLPRQGGEWVHETDMAERGGFEPPVRDDRTTDFESAAFVHSATSPGGVSRVTGRRRLPVKRCQVSVGGGLDAAAARAALRAAFFRWRMPWKKDRRRSPQRSASTPAVTGKRWLRRASWERSARLPM